MTTGDDTDIISLVSFALCIACVGFLAFVGVAAFQMGAESFASSKARFSSSADGAGDGPRQTDPDWRTGGIIRFER